VRGWAGAAADLVSLVGRAVERPEQVLGDLVGGLRVVAVRVVVQQLAEDSAVPAAIAGLAGGRGW
jgi:hypothetical protein